MTEPIVVGVDGSQPAERALLWAADEAALHGSQLLIVHCGEVLTRHARAHGDARDYSHGVLREAVATAIDASDVTDISTLLRDDQPAGVLLGSVAHRIAAHARCPVVVVPEEWRAPARGDARPVAVGVSGTPSGRDALEFAFTEAEHAEVRLVAVRSCAEINRAGDEASATWRRHQALLAELVEAAWANHPGVEVVSELSSASVYETLHDVAGRASLLVLGCRHAEDSHLARLGPVSSRLLHSSPCPVAIVGRPVALATANVADELALAGQS